MTDLSRWSRDQVFAVHSVRPMRAKGVRAALAPSGKVAEVFQEDAAAYLGG